MIAKSRRSLAAALIGSSALVAPALCLGLLTAPTSAAAQAASSSSTDVEGIVVTGTLFRTHTETASPVTVMSADQIQNAGITTVTDAIRSVSADNSGTLPTAFAGAFAAGASGVALRGLTVNSTIVLIDGFRTVAYPIGDDGERAFVDLNTIPESIIDRVDVLKDGASSIYGADAIGGVVNIIFKPTFNGEEVNGDVGTTQHGGGTSEHFDGTVGFGHLEEDRFNAYFNIEYQHDDDIQVGQRPFPFNTSNLTSIGGVNPGNGQPAVGGPGAGSIYGTVTPINPVSGLVTGPTQVLAPGGCGPKGTLSSFTNSAGFASTYCAQDLELYNVDQPQETRGGFYGRFTVKINPTTTAYLTASYYQNEVTADGVFAPAQINQFVPYNTTGIVLPVGNPSNPFPGQQALLNYAFGDIPGYEQFDNHVFRSVADVRGTAWGWDYEATGIVAHSWLDSTYTGLINYQQLVADVADGAYNFANPSANSPAVRAALAPPDSFVSTSDMDGINLSATRGLYDLQGGPLNLALGAAWRYEAEDEPDLNPLANGNPAFPEYNGDGNARAIGQRTVTSAFAELDAPLLKTLSVNLSGRFDHYSDSGNNFAPKAGIKWTPIPEVALRGTYSTGYRAPSFSENSNSFFEGFEQLTLATIDPAYNTAHGSGSGYSAPYFIGQAASGNPNLKPEKSQNFTVGAVVQPIHSVSVSLDFYHIEKTDVIAQGNANAVLTDYFAGQALPSGTSLTLDTPDPATCPSGVASTSPTSPCFPKPLVAFTPWTNANKIQTDGLDLNIRFHHDLWWDLKLTSDLNISDIFMFRYSTAGSPSYNYVGTESPYNLSSGAGTPKYKANWQTALQRGPVTVAVTVYYTSPIKMEALDIAGPGCFSSGSVNASFPNACLVDAFVDADLHASYDVTDKIQIYGDVKNLLDTLPPLDPINYAGINYNPTYSQAGIVGRYFQIGVRAKF